MWKTLSEKELFNEAVGKNEVGYCSLDTYIALEEQDLKAQATYVQLLKELKKQYPEMDVPTYRLWSDINCPRRNPVETLQDFMEYSRDYSRTVNKEKLKKKHLTVKQEVLGKRAAHTSLQGTVEQYVKQLIKDILDKEENEANCTAQSDTCTKKRRSGRISGRRS